MLAVHIENGRVELREKPLPARPKGFALIRLVCGGICNTDLELQRGYYNFANTPGHEFVGEVVEADTPALVGARVTGEINLNCGECDWCRRGLGRHCPHRSVLGIVNHPGAFSEFFTLPERNLHVLPAGLATEDAVFTEPLAAACEIFEQVSIPRGAEVAVLGDGKLGMLIALALEARGIKVHLFGRHAEKMRIAAAAGAAVHEAKDLPASAYDWVVEATGSALGLQQAAAMARPRGVVIMKSTVHEEVAIDTAPLIVNEITLIGSRCGRFEPALEMLLSGAVRPAAMISRRFPLAEAPEAFAKAAEKGALKILITN
ncbi:MAG: MDR/zinc-dependent alcohol dehydrogenase-like family protein [Rhodospirillales bacterium]